MIQCTKCGITVHHYCCGTEVYPELQEGRGFICDLCNVVQKKKEKIVPIYIYMYIYIALCGVLEHRWVYEEHREYLGAPYLCISFGFL